MEEKEIDLQIYKAFIENTQVSIWACNEQFKIVLWNRGAEEIYGYSKEEAIGKNYLELFVDEPERDESEKFCMQIIKHGFVQRNSLAYDKSKTGRRCHMLTNCFPIRNPETGEIYQAEVGVEMTDLRLREDEHRTLREVGIERIARKKETMDIVMCKTIADIDSEINKLLSEMNSKKAEQDEWVRKTEDRDTDIVREQSKKEKARIEAEYNKKIYRLEELKNKARLCNCTDDVNDVRACLLEVHKK